MHSPYWLILQGSYNYLRFTYKKPETSSFDNLLKVTLLAKVSVSGLEATFVFYRKLN